MRKLFLLLLLLFSIQVFAQDEPVAARILSSKLDSFYNYKKYDSIFSMFSTRMQVALPLSATTIFFEGLMQQAGRIVKRTFSHSREGFAYYNTDFENGSFRMKLAVDNENKFTGLMLEPYVDDKEVVTARNTTAMRLPFKAEWMVVWGGDTKDLNYHVTNRAQKNAFDLYMVNSEGSSYRTNGTVNEDFYAFGQDLLAPCNGEVVLVLDGIADNKPGEMNAAVPTGNMVIIKANSQEFAVLAHFKQHSIVVKEGQQVKAGDVLGKCGNSGNSSEAHLHFHLQDKKDMKEATGIKCYFDKLMVNGDLRTDYSPVQKEKIREIPN